jgi:DNA invertase Pin-like site-specific DNA recombinase
VGQKSKNANEPDSEHDTSRSPQRIGYARVSTNEQNLDMQIEALHNDGCTNVYEEKISARSKHRPQLELAIKELQEGDTFVVWRLDRLARSMRELLRRLDQFEHAKAKFKSLMESFDTDNFAGQAMLYMAGVFAELEGQLIAQRTKAGMAMLAERGHKFGAKLKFTEAKRAQARKLLQATKVVERGSRKVVRPKHSRRSVAKRLGISYQTLYVWIKQGMK